MRAIFLLRSSRPAASFTLAQSLTPPVGTADDPTGARGRWHGGRPGAHTETPATRPPVPEQIDSWPRRVPCLASREPHWPSARRVAAPIAAVPSTSDDRTGRPLAARDCPWPRRPTTAGRRRLTPAPAPDPPRSRSPADSSPRARCVAVLRPEPSARRSQHDARLRPSPSGRWACRRDRAQTFGVCGSTRPAPDGARRTAAEAATLDHCGDVVGARRTAGGRGGGPARPRARLLRPEFQAVALLLRTSAPASGRRPEATVTGPSSSSAWTASRPSSRRPPSRMLGYWRCSPRTPTSPTRPGRSSGRCCGTSASSCRRRDRAGGARPLRLPEQRVVPQSVISRQLANPFLAPTSPPFRSSPLVRSRLASWNCSARC